MALVVISTELIHSIRNAFGNRSVFTLDDYQRNAIHKQNQIRNDVPFPAIMSWRAFNLELIHHGKGVVLRVGPVNKVNGLPSTAIPIW